ncbi:MAG: S9 family peptidase [Phycisphaerae bacterium]|nr:S9 family peptidase [Phycisphaerae bacterium]
MPTRTKRSSKSSARRTATRAKERATHARRPIDAEDLLCFVGLGDPQMAPDGSRVAFVRTVANDDAKLESSIWMADVGEGAAPRALTRGTKDSMPRFAPDSRSVAFLRASEGRATQIATIALDGGEARILTRFPEGSFRAISWSPDGKRLLVSHRTTEAEWTTAAKRERERQGKGEPPRIIESRWHRLDGDGWFGNARHQLYIVDARTGNATPIYDGDTLGDADAAWSPDGETIAITTNRHRDALTKPWKSEILLLNVARGTLTALEGLPIGPKLGVAWSPDGRHLAWAGRVSRDGAYSTENLEVWVAPVDKKAASPGRRGRAAKSAARSLTHHTDYCLLAPTLSDSTEVAFRPTISWRDDETLVARVGWHGGGHVMQFSLDGSAPIFLTEGLVEFTVGSVSKDGSRLAALRSTPTELAEAGVVEFDRRRPAATWKSLTSFNGALAKELELVAPTEHWVTADDGHRTHVWVIRPPRSAPGGNAKRPAILQIHGGPHTQYGASFFHEFQLLAARGYVVVYSNPRGSKGYGRDHCAAIRGSWGDRDWADIQAVTEFMRTLPGVDPKRLGIAGGSYGGYMTNWAIGHSKAYRAAITDRCVSNLVSMAGNSDYPLEPGEYWPGSAYENAEAMWRMSPIAYFKGVTTPTLIIHSEGDLRCNIEQAEEVHTALCLQHVPTRFVRYPAYTSHGMSRSGPPDMKIHRLRENLAWWKRWL